MNLQHLVIQFRIEIEKTAGIGQINMKNVERDPKVMLKEGKGAPKAGSQKDTKGQSTGGQRRHQMDRNESPGQPNGFIGRPWKPKGIEKGAEGSPKQPRGPRAKGAPKGSQWPAEGHWGPGSGSHINPPSPAKWPTRDDHISC